MTMHRVVRAAVAVTVFLIGPGVAFAQQVGVKGGINVARLTPEDEDEEPLVDNRIGLVGGGWVRWPISPGFSFQVEGLFSEQGVRFNVPTIEGFPGGELDLRVRYILVPVLARGDFGAATSSTRFFVVGGLAPSFNVAARARLEFEGQTETRNAGDEIKPFDLGLVGGAGVEFGRAMVEARYTHGLLHINEDDNGDDRIRNRVFSIMAGFRFR